MKFCSLLLLILSLITGCATHHSKFVEATNRELYHFVVSSNGIDSARSKLNSPVYALPSIDWINKEFTPALKDFYWKNGLTHYTKWENDCVKFSAHAISVAYNVYYHDSDKLNEHALAVGLFDYYPVFSSIGHEIIFFVAHDHGKKVLIFYEPQAQKEASMSLFDFFGVVYWNL